MFSIKTNRIVHISLILTLVIIGPIILGVTIESISIRLQCYVSNSIITIEKRTYHLEVFISRDFMPISPPGGKPLCVLVRIKLNDSTDFPTTLDVKYVWVINNFLFWKSKLKTLETPYGTNYLVKVALGGPKWGPEISVDVLIQLIYNSERLYYLKAENQLIKRYF